MVMRYPAEQKVETHEKILAAAARSFREHGSQNNGIGRVMKELGLTKGGFYRHFESKGDLYAAAVARGFEELGNRMVAVAEAAPKGEGLRAMIEDYLSAKHLNAPGTGCPLAALAPEIARQPLEVRKRINQSMLAFRERLIPYVPGRTVEQKRGRFFILFPGMAGILAAARAIADPQGRERMLAAARSFYLETFASEKTG
jgi:TetR/AcrR family transcriptional repressor of nem operon